MDLPDPRASYLAERRRIQCRIAQRKYRQKLRQRLEAAEKAQNDENSTAESTSQPASMAQQQNLFLPTESVSGVREHNSSSDAGNLLTSSSKSPSFPTLFKPSVDSGLAQPSASTNEAALWDFGTADSYTFVADAYPTIFPATTASAPPTRIMIPTPPETMGSSSADNLPPIQPHHTEPRRPSSPSGNPISASENSWLGAIHIAAQKGHERIVSSLLTKGISINEQDDDGRTPVMLATIGGHSVIVRNLLESNAQIDYIDHEGRSAMHWAAIKCNEEILSMLLEASKNIQDFDIDAYDNMGWTALHSAIDRGFEAGMELLLQHGANVNFRAKRCPESGNIIPMSPRR